MSDSETELPHIDWDAKEKRESREVYDRRHREPDRARFRAANGPIDQAELP
jgi:hypothetical protein